MKKAFAVALLGSLMLSGAANAATYRVDFNGTVEDGTYGGYFTYDTAGLNLNGNSTMDLTPRGVDDLSGSGFETKLLFNYSFSGASGSFNDGNAGVGDLSMSSGNLISWFTGADANGVFRITYAGPEAIVADFGLCSACADHAGWLFLPDIGRLDLSFPDGR